MTSQRRPCDPLVFGDQDAHQTSLGRSDQLDDQRFQPGSSSRTPWRARASPPFRLLHVEASV
jgi:hypothetical protein